MAANARIDGIKLRWPYLDYEIHQNRYYHLVEMLASNSGWSEQQVMGYIKYQKVKSGIRGGGELTSVFIGGKLAKHLDATWLDEQLPYVAEVQTKWYLVEGNGRGQQAFEDAVWSARWGSFRPAFYGAQGKRGRSEPGSRGLSFSTGKSDVHVGIRRYRGERAGVEAHVKGQTLRSTVSEVRDRREREYPAGNAPKSFPEIQYQASLRGARRFLRALRSRGIVLTDYFQGVSYISWERPLHEIAWELLDADEERKGAALGMKPGFIGSDDQGQLPLFETE